MGIKIGFKPTNKNCHAEFISASNPPSLVGKILILLGAIGLKLGQLKQAVRTFCTKNKFSAKEVKQVQDDIVIFICVFLVLFFCTETKAFAQAMPTIVKVAISNNDFKSVEYNEVSIIATSDYAVYDKKTCLPLAKLAATDVLKIKMNQNVFELSVAGKIISKGQNETLVIDCPKGVLGIENLKRHGKQALYHGVFEITPRTNKQNAFFVVNTLDIQSYLKGVVPNEMPVRFGLEALKAQSIAARNYVLTPRTRSFKEFDVDDSVASQVYFGANTEDTLSNRAVAETEGLVALYNWELILAQYSSTAGGYTESFENAFSDPKTKEFPSHSKPYLMGRPDIYSVGPLNREEEARIFYMSCPDSYDMKSPYYRWQKQWERAELEAVLAKTLIAQSKTGFIKPEFKEGDVLGELQALTVKRRGVSGKVMELEIVTDKGTYHVFKELVIRRLLQKTNISLPSANVVFENLYNTDKKLNKIVAYGGGFGHGVGMSQYGAGFMSNSLHKSFDKILKRYYTEITISTCPVILSDNELQQQISQTFFTTEQKAIIVIDNKYQIEEIKAKINGKDITLILAKNIVPVHRISRIDVSSYIKLGKNEIIFFMDPKEKNKAIRLYIELVEKDESNYNF
jgi:SpoIID/LytB domain protein